MLFDNFTVSVDKVFDDLKWINSDFSSSNFTAFRSTHENTFWTISISNLQFSFALFDWTSIATSSIMLYILMFIFIFQNKNRIYIESKMDEIDDLYGIQVRIVRAACFFPSHANSIFRLIMNDLTYRIDWFNVLICAKWQLIASLKHD